MLLRSFPFSIPFIPSSTLLLQARKDMQPDEKLECVDEGLVSYGLEV